MPEGPSVRKFHHLVSPFVGQQVIKTGGSSKKLPPAVLQSLWLLDARVHGKQLFLRFDPSEEVELPGSHLLPESLQKGAEEEGPEDPSRGSGTGSQQRPCAGASGSAEPGTGSPERPGGHGPAPGAQRWLQLRFGLFGSVRVSSFSRAKKANKRGDWKDPVPRLVLHFGGGGFLAFYSCQVAWSPPPGASPTCDILSEVFHRGQALEALGGAQPVCYTLMDQRFFSGLGNIIKSEALHRAGIHPLSPGTRLAPAQLEALVDQVMQFSSEWLRNKVEGTHCRRQIYLKEQCPAGHLVVKEALGPPAGFQRVTWWCPQCQPLPPEEPQPQGPS
ncbi:endonuclease 8-like 2 [Perognathus longimembris pacificus]|uniref:endonuclease 8-like 2 n=1 Tax=Perognathus longimembris pacificus TaxID=214514 RepID=UPI00201A1891|nr:endonuclease 8-like 2 [Perognathus longimembris pacificus]